MPSRVKTAPWAELKSGLFSSWETAKVAASRAETEEPGAPRGKDEGEMRKWCEVERIFRRESRYDLYFLGGRLEGVILPAPPWMMRRGVMDDEKDLYSMLLSRC